MKKSVLLDFISKYSIGNTIQKVNWKIISSEKVLRTRGDLDSKSFIVDVIWKNFTDLQEDIRIPIADTEKIKEMLSPFEDDVTFTINKEGDRIKGFTISDSFCESYCTAAEPSAIPPVLKNLEDSSDWDVEMILTPEFIEKFLKARSALKEITEFTIKLNKNNKLEFVLGYSVANTNRINLLVPTVQGKDTFTGQPVKFPIHNVAEVLKAHKNEDKGGIASFHPKGGLKLKFETDNFVSLYYQFVSSKK